MTASPHRVCNRENDSVLAQQVTKQCKSYLIWLLGDLAAWQTPALIHKRWFDIEFWINDGPSDSLETAK